MGLLDRLEQRRPARIAAELTEVEDLRELIDLAMGGPAASGETVNVKRALECPPVAAAVQVMGESVAQLPFRVFQNLGDRQIEERPEHDVNALLGSRGKPNEWQTPFEFFEQGTRDVALRGNFYAFKNLVADRLRSLDRLVADKVTVKQDDNFRIRYTVTTPGGGTRDLTSREIFHLRGPSDNGVAGNHVVKQMRHAIGLALAQDKHASKLFANGARLSGWLEHPGVIGPEGTERLREAFERIFGGADNAYKTAVFEEGMKFKEGSMTAEAAQLIESRTLQRSVLAAIWRVPPHMIGDLEKATFSNIEHLARQFVDYALMPWLRRWEQAIGTQLLSDAERAAGLFVKLDPRGLLRGDSKARADFYTKGIAATWLSPNEVREKEDMPPRDGGDEFKNPNITAADMADPDAPEGGRTDM
ncbi:MAG TPA: phage portal protein [Kiloniellales bacterium]